ncbi:MAG: methyltransferase domain-containing protein [Alicyclobacillus sp.]|nr:methyltransferase domain-containing protein [Alicyclobacillus sp.]
MRIPNFRSEAGSILYKNTVGRRISPRVAQLLLQQAETVMASQPVHDVLDLGCGPGTVSLTLAARYPTLHIEATDASAAMVDLARAEAERLGLSNLTFAEANANHLELPPASFDLVVCNLAFPFFPRPYESMAAVADLLRPGGTACFTVPGARTWEAFFAVAETVFGDSVRVARPFLVKFQQAEVLPDALAKAGFHDVTETRTLLPFSFDSGEAVLRFFTELFHLLDSATPDMRAELADAVDRLHPNGFTMHYEAVLLTAGT